MLVMLLIAMILFAVAAIGYGLSRAPWPACVAAGLALWALASLAPHLGLH